MNIYEYIYLLNELSLIIKDNGYNFKITISEDYKNIKLEVNKV